MISCGSGFVVLLYGETRNTLEGVTEQRYVTIFPESVDLTATCSSQNKAPLCHVANT